MCLMVVQGVGNALNAREAGLGYPTRTIGGASHH